jgi:hypothetical protein
LSEPNHIFELVDLGITIDETTENVVRFLDLVQRKGMRAKETAPENSYTRPSTDEAQHVRHTPLYARSSRFYEFDESSFALADYDQPDGTIHNAGKSSRMETVHETSAEFLRWRVMKATNIHGAEPNEPIDLFHVYLRRSNTKLPTYSYPTCKK